MLSNYLSILGMLKSYENFVSGSNSTSKYSNNLFARLQGSRQAVNDRQIMNNQSHTSMNIDDHYLDNLHKKLNIYSI